MPSISQRKLDELTQESTQAKERAEHERLARIAATAKVSAFDGILDKIERAANGQSLVDTQGSHWGNCLCVLAPGADEAEDYEGALRQLATWVRHLDGQGFRVTTSPRKPSSSIDMLFHGIEYAYLTTAAGGGVDHAD